MRKTFKLKKRSCALCKPHKMGWVNRWKPQEYLGLKEFDKIKQETDQWEKLSDELWQQIKD